MQNIHKQSFSLDFQLMGFSLAHICSVNCNFMLILDNMRELAFKSQKPRGDFFLNVFICINAER